MNAPLRLQMMTPSAATHGRPAVSNTYDVLTSVVIYIACRCCHCVDVFPCESYILESVYCNGSPKIRKFNLQLCTALRVLFKNLVSSILKDVESHIMM